jgi:hypothetical protein
LINSLFKLKLVFQEHGAVFIYNDLGSDEASSFLESSDSRSLFGANVDGNSEYVVVAAPRSSAAAEGAGLINIYSNEAVH